MKAAVVHEFGAEEALRYEEVPPPAPGPGEVLVRVRAAGVNRGDLARRAGTYPGGNTLSGPLIIGWEIAGVVEALGPDLSTPALGTRIVARVPQGGYAEVAAAPVEQTAVIPDGVSFEQAAALPVAYLTAWFALHRQGALALGESCLVQAGASGVGVAAIQLAALAGARVFATAGSEAKLALARRLGAAIAIDYEREDFVAAVRRETGGRGVDLVLDSVGGDVLARSLDVLAPGGRLVSVGNSARRAAPVDLAQLVGRRLSLFGFALPGEHGQGEALAELLHLVAAGRLESVIDRSYPLAEAAEAHRYLASRANLGKLLLIP